MQHGNQKFLPNKQQQQGDVCLDLVPLPEKAQRKNGRVILAYGEATGHLHEVIGEGVELYEDGDVMYVVIPGEEAAVLTHQEHHTQTLDPTPPGYAWRRRIVREYDHFAEEARQVRD